MLSTNIRKPPLITFPRPPGTPRNINLSKRKMGSMGASLSRTRLDVMLPRTVVISDKTILKNLPPLIKTDTVIFNGLSDKRLGNVDIEADELFFEDCDKNFTFFTILNYSRPHLFPIHYYLNSHPADGQILYRMSRYPDSILYLTEPFAYYKKRYAEFLPNVKVMNENTYNNKLGMVTSTDSHKVINL